MHSKSLHVLVLLLVVPMIFISCVMKKAPDKEEEKKASKPRKGALVYKISGSTQNVYLASARC